VKVLVGTEEVEVSGIVTQAIEDKLPLNGRRIQAILGSAYIDRPDFNSQDFYNWLSEFTELVGCLVVPISAIVFSKVNQTEKHIANCLAEPNGVVRCKQNYMTLMKIGEQLKTTLNRHLLHVVASLEEDSVTDN